MKLFAPAFSRARGASSLWSMTRRKGELSNAAIDRDFSFQVAPMQVALAWLLRRSPNILLIPGTSSVKMRQ